MYRRSMLQTNATSAFSPPLDNFFVFLILFLTFGVALLLVVIMLYLTFRSSREKEPWAAGEIKFLSSLFVRVTESVTLVLIVFAVVILGLFRIIDAQGITSILSAVAGYVLGRASRIRESEAEREAEARARTEAEAVAKKTGES